MSSWVFNSHRSHCLKLKHDFKDSASLTDCIKTLKISISFSKQKKSFICQKMTSGLQVFGDRFFYHSGWDHGPRLTMITLNRSRNLLSKNMPPLGWPLANFDLLYKYSICKIRNNYTRCWRNINSNRAQFFHFMGHMQYEHLNMEYEMYLYQHCLRNISETLESKMNCYINTRQSNAMQVNGVPDWTSFDNWLRSVVSFSNTTKA